MKARLLAAALATLPALPARAGGLDQVDHFVVLFLENRSFDNLFALFPGASGLGDAYQAPVQRDRDGRPYAALPPVPKDPRFPELLPNRPWLIDAHVPQADKAPDLVHRFYQNQAQINGGANDRFVAHTDVGGLVMGYHDIRGSALWRLAERYTLADNFFQGAFGGSFFNHIWLACACAPTYPDAPAAIRAELDAAGRLVKDGMVTPDGHAVNTIQPRNGPHAPGLAAEKTLPQQSARTLGDALSEKGVSWAWYSGGWNEAEAGRAGPLFQYHHQPYAFFAGYAPGTPERAAHLKDDAELFAALKQGRPLPQVAFVKPNGPDNQHPGYANLVAADAYVAELAGLLERHPDWPRIALIVTYDENGGFWDHVAPPKGDRWGPGSRIPALVVSPLARKGWVDHTPYETTSILRTLERRFGLKRVGERKAATLEPAFE